MGLITFAVGGFFVPMSYNNTRWRVVQVEPLEFSTTVDNGIILRGADSSGTVEVYIHMYSTKRGVLGKAII